MRFGAGRGLAIWTLVLIAVVAAASSAQTPPASDEELDLLRLKAEERFVADDLEGAVVLYRRLADRMPTPEDKLRVLMTVASVEHLADRDADAQRTLTEALVLDPDLEFRAELYDDRFRQLFYEAQKRSLEERASLASRHARDGIGHMRRDDLVAARHSLQQALSYDPGHPSALYNLALTELRDGREDAAIAGFQRLLALAGGPSSEFSADVEARALTNLGYLYSRRRQYQEAEDVLRQAAELDADNPLILLNLGDVRRRQGKKAEAAEAFRRAYELAPGDADVASNLALSHIDSEDWGRAVMLLRDITGRHPDRPLPWLYLGRTEAALGDGSAAVAAFAKAIRLDPDNAASAASDAALHLAIYYYSVGDYATTLQQADRALSWEPGLVNARVYLGLAQQGLGNLQDARESLEEARRLDPTRAATHNNLGSVYYALGRLQDARAAFERAVEIDPGLADARRNLDAVRQAGG
ncbi:MAG: tetratricopeptide repeat protein [Thermoanaerobaculia bacterium]